MVSQAEAVLFFSLGYGRLCPLDFLFLCHDSCRLKAAVLTVQRIYRGLRVRLQLLRAREEEVKKLRGDLTNSWASVKNSSADFGVAVIRRLMEIDPEMAHSCCFAADMRFFAVVG